uniref:Conotoxin superfamily I3 n=1 Tax=Conus ermineus TaxID=55423 RepID=A0A346CJ80_CONER|nr:conotoxin precursor superfamily I3 [Conus ermineus]
MKLSLAIVLILMLLSLSTGAETSDNHASRSATALRDRLLGPKTWSCQWQGETCSHHHDCCGSLCCAGSCVMTIIPCK